MFSHFISPQTYVIQVLIAMKEASLQNQPYFFISIIAVVIINGMKTIRNLVQLLLLMNQKILATLQLIITIYKEIHDKDKGQIHTKAQIFKETIEENALLPQYNVLSISDRDKCVLHFVQMIYFKCHLTIMRRVTIKYIFVYVILDLQQKIIARE